MPSIRYNRLVRYVLPSLLCCLGAMGSVVAQAHPPEANPRTSGAQENERRIAATTEVAKLAIDEELPLSAELESAVRHVRGASNATLKTGTDGNFGDDYVSGHVVVTDQRLAIALTNRMDTPAKVSWDAASFVDVASIAHRLITDSVAPINRNQPQPTVLLPSNSAVDVGLLSVDHIHWAGGRWVVYGMLGGNTQKPIGARISFSFEVETETNVVQYRFSFRLSLARELLEIGRLRQRVRQQVQSGMSEDDVRETIGNIKIDKQQELLNGERTELWILSGKGIAIRFDALGKVVRTEREPTP